MDSFLHRTEDSLPIARVEGLPGQLNAKYDRASGVALEGEHDTLRRDFDRHAAAAEGLFGDISDDMEDLRGEESRQRGEIDALTDGLSALETACGRRQGEIDTLKVGVEGILRTDAAQDGMIATLQTETGSAAAALEQLCRRLHPTAGPATLESAFSALGAEYGTLWALANTLKTFLEAGEGAGRTVPRSMSVEIPAVSLNDPERRYIRVILQPESAVRNVIFLSDGKVVDVDPDGGITVLKAGTGRVHVIPTENTAIARTVTVTVLNKPIPLDMRPPLMADGACLMAGEGILLTDLKGI